MGYQANSRIVALGLETERLVASTPGPEHNGRSSIFPSSPVVVRAGNCHCSNVPWGLSIDRRLGLLKVYPARAAI